MNGFNRAERLLNKWANNQSTGLTDAGKDWFVAAADPFHDTNLKNLHGWPDVETGTSVIRLVKQSADISKPSTFPDANWDCHLALMPFLNAQTFATSNLRSNNAFTISGTSTRGPLGGLTICPTLANNDADFLPITGTGNNINLTMPAAFEKGVGRLIAIGFEVHCTADAISNRGALTAYKQLEAGRDPVLYYGFISDSAALVLGDYSLTGSPIRMPPVNKAQAMLLPGTRSWDFKEGAYVPVTFHSTVNKPFSVDYNAPVLYPHGTDDNMSPVNTTNISVPNGTSNSISVTKNTVQYQKYSTPGQHIHPIHQTGVILTGLASGSTFSVILNMYYETFPSTAELEVLPLTTPSARFDPTALEMYSHAISLMPVAVKVADNSSGDWFMNLISQVGKMAAPLLAMIPHPVAKIAAPIAAAIGSIEEKPKRKNIQKKNNQLREGRRGKKGQIQGPLPAPGPGMS